MATMDATTAQPQAPFELDSRTLGAAPIVRHFCERLRLRALLERYLPASDARLRLSSARALAALITNLAISREPLYGLGAWVCRHEPCALGLAPGDAEHLNDDRAGRALDRLFGCDRGSLLCELVLTAIREFEVETSQLHNDSTSISVHGAYTHADGRERAGRATVAICHGHSKDHRPDLKQLVVILTVSADGAVPLAQRVCDGNTSDSSTHIETWEGLRALLGRCDFLYVADCKLATAEQMRHIDRNAGRFVSVLPRSRSETARLCDWMRDSEPRWVQAARTPPRRKGDPDDVWSVAPAPFQSAEGYRIVWVHSTNKQQLDEHARRDSLARGLAALDDLQQRLAGPKCRFHHRAAVESAAAAALRRAGVSSLVDIDIDERLDQWTREESRGTGRKPARRHVQRLRFTLHWRVDEAALARETAAYGCFALITNDRDLTDAEVLTAYRYQPNLERRHHEFKSVLEAAPIYLHSPARIEALLTCQFIALLLHALIERELRRAMTREQIERLPLYPEQRACRAPTADRVFELFAPLQRHHLLADNTPVQLFEPHLTTLHQQILELLDLPLTSYRATTPTTISPPSRGAISAAESAE
jgi:transposase